MEVTITPEEVEREFGSLPAGARIKCDKCLYPCEGFDYLPERSATDVGPRIPEDGDVPGTPGA